MNEPNNTAATVFVYRHKATGEVAAHYTDAACIKQALPDWKLVASLEPRLWIQANWRQAGAIPMPDPSAHIYPSDLERFKTDETFGHAYSVAVGNPDERSVPLYTLSDLVAYSLALVAEERARCADLAAPERFVYSDEEWRVRCEIRDAINDHPSANKCKRKTGLNGEPCGLTPPCPDCGLSCHDVVEGG